MTNGVYYCMPVRDLRCTSAHWSNIHDSPDWYELVKEWQAAGNRARGGRGNLAPLQSLLAGALAGILECAYYIATRQFTSSIHFRNLKLSGSATVLITNPIWMINTRIAVTGGRNSEESSGETASEASFATKGSSKTVQRQQGAWDMVKSVVREEGVLSLWQGVMPALILVSNPSIQYMVRMCKGADVRGL